MSDEQVQCSCPHTQLLQQFYDWEQRGRGWRVLGAHVRPEPAFVPFLGHWIPAPPAAADNGQRPTFFSRIASLFTSRVAPALPLPASEENGGDERPTEDRSEPLVDFQILLPSDSGTSFEEFEQVLVAGTCPGQLTALEIRATAERVTCHMSVAEELGEDFIQQLAGHFPQIVLDRDADSLADSMGDVTEDDVLVVDFGLSREFMLPIATAKTMAKDPFVSLMNSLASLRRGEVATYQVLFEPVHHPWSGSIARAVTGPDGKPFFDDKDFYTQSKEKIARPLFAAIVRIAVAAPTRERMWVIARMITRSLGQFSSPSGNELIPLSNDDYDDGEHLADFMNRRSRRSGMLLNSEELTSLVHLPGDEVQHPKFVRLVKKTKAAPVSVLDHSLVLGSNRHASRDVVPSLNQEQRMRHMHVIGGSGTGKSTFLLNLILQDIEQGNGIGVLDPHGDLIEQILGRIPEHRMRDVVLVDPSDDEYPVGFNILSAHSDLEKTLLSSDLVGIFRRFSSTWGDQMGSVLANAVLAYLESTTGGTLADLRRFLIEPPYRNEFLTTVQDSQLVYYWKKEFSLLSGRPQAPLLTRLDTFLRPKPVRYMVGQRKNRLDFSDIMDTGKIFLAKLGQGSIGEENAYLLGSLFVSKFHQLALGRQAQSENTRRPFYLYCDEFGGYVTPSMAKLLSGARKFKLGLCLSHQDMHQLHDKDVETALLANAGTRVCFRLGDSDAKTLADGFSFFEPEDFRNLGVGEAICRVGRSDDDFTLSTAMADDIDPEVAQSRRQAIVKFTRERYAQPRAEVEAELACEREDVPPPPKRTEERAAALAPLPSPPPLLVPPIVTPPEQVPPTPIPRKKRESVALEEAKLGKGGQQHKYLQELLSRWAQGMGYHTTIEMPTPDGAGSIDVVLERADRKIAVEISVTTGVEHELGNLRKCLAAGFKEVVMVCAKPKTLTALSKAAQAEVDSQALKLVRFVSPDELFASADFLQVITQDEPVRGYKVKVRLQPVGDRESTERRRAVSSVLLKTMSDKG